MTILLNCFDLLDGFWSIVLLNWAFIFGSMYCLLTISYGSLLHLLFLCWKLEWIDNSISNPCFCLILLLELRIHDFLTCTFLLFSFFHLLWYWYLWMSGMLRLSGIDDWAWNIDVYYSYLFVYLCLWFENMKGLNCRRGFSYQGLTCPVVVLLLWQFLWYAENLHVMGLWFYIKGFDIGMEIDLWFLDWNEDKIFCVIRL